MPVEMLEGNADFDAEVDLDFDLDVEIEVRPVTAGPAVTSKSICTPGCTSAGGGSFCSYCCC